MDNTNSADIHVLNLLLEGWSLSSKDNSGHPAYLTSIRHEYVEVPTPSTMSRLIEQGLVECSGSDEATGIFAWKLTTQGTLIAADAEALGRKNRSRWRREKS